MSFKTLKFKITGVAPLLVHNGQTADPLNQYAQALKKVSGKRQKTEEDYKEMARIEWYASLYLKDKKPCIPAYVFESCLVSGAKKTKRGKLALSGIFVQDDALIEFKGTNDIDKMFESGKYTFTFPVRVQNARIMRTRARFDEWSLTVTIQYDPKVLNESDVVDIVNAAGDVGLCEWRPKFGRFSAKKL